MAAAKTWSYSVRWRGLSAVFALSMLLALVVPSSAWATTGRDDDRGRRTADLVLAKRDTADPVARGDRLTYILRVTNHGPDDATDVRILDLLPPQVRYRSSSEDCRFDVRRGAVLCRVGDLDDGDSARVRVEVTVQKGEDPRNIAAVSSDMRDRNMANNRDWERTRVERADARDSECFDAEDNDGDGSIDAGDQGCSGPTDNDEGDDATSPDPNTGAGTDDATGTGVVECADGIDNDGDTLTDFVEGASGDPDCTDATDTTELPDAGTGTDDGTGNATAECGDGVDNDSDGVIETSTPTASESETLTTGDDTDCTSADDTTEGADLDGDGVTDSATGTGAGATGTCFDGVDNDGDGTLDEADPDCAAASEGPAATTSETISEPTEDLSATPTETVTTEDTVATTVAG